MAQALDELNNAVDEVVGEYGVFTNSVIGNFHYATRDQNLQKGLLVFDEGTGALLASVVGSLWLKIGLSSQALFVSAFAEANKSTGASEKAPDTPLISSIVENTLLAINRQMLKDVGDAELDIKRLIIGASLSKRADGGQTDYSAFFGAKKTVKLAYVDRAGRRWGSDRYIRSVARSHYIGIYSDAFAIAAIKSGKSEIILSSGVSIPLEDYGRLRDKYLHPNTKSLPVAIK